MATQVFYCVISENDKTSFCGFVKQIVNLNNITNKSNQSEDDFLIKNIFMMMPWWESKGV